MYHLFSNKYTIHSTGYQNKTPEKSLHDKAERNTDTRETEKNRYNDKALKKKGISLQ